MRVMEDAWPAENERRVLVAHLFEVSLVAKPANPGALVTAFRHETRSATGLEFRAVPLRALAEHNDRTAAAKRR
jgi:phage head maturation protease